MRYRLGKKLLLWVGAGLILIVIGFPFPLAVLIMVTGPIWWWWQKGLAARYRDGGGPG